MIIYTSYYNVVEAGTMWMIIYFFKRNSKPHRGFGYETTLGWHEGEKNEDLLCDRSQQKSIHQVCNDSSNYSSKRKNRILLEYLLNIVLLYYSRIFLLKCCKFHQYHLRSFFEYDSFICKWQRTLPNFKVVFIKVKCLWVVVDFIQEKYKAVPWRGREIVLRDVQREVQKT